MGRKIDVSNLIVETELNIWTSGLTSTIQSIIESYLLWNKNLNNIEDLSEFIAYGLKEEQSNRQIFDISTHVDHYRADTI